MECLAFLIGLVYALYSEHYVAKSLHKKLKSVGLEVAQDVKSFTFRLFK